MSFDKMLGSLNAKLPNLNKLVENRKGIIKIMPVGYLQVPQMKSA